MRKFLAVLAALALTGCASVSLPSHPQPQSVSEALANLKGDVQIDLAAADAIAVAHGDVLAHACYPVLAKYLAPQGGTVSADQIKGVFSAFEEARATRKSVEGKSGGSLIPDDLKLGCAALLQDERDFLVRLAVIAGGASVGAPGVGSAIGGAAGALPGLIAPLLPR
jgi:hypothetical protein